jgi:hypothetical protein
VWLDEKVAQPVRFDPGTHGTIFHATLLDDLAEGGALRRQIRGGQRGEAARHLDEIRRRFESTPPDRQRFVDLGGSLSPGNRMILRRWAAMRYYTSPQQFDPPDLIREVPKSVAALASGCSREHIPALQTLDDAAPIGQMKQLLVPTLGRNSDSDTIRQVIDVLIETRERHPSARKIFANLNNSASGDLGLRGVMVREFARQHRIASRSARRARAFQWIGVGIGLGSTAASLGMSPESSTALGIATSLIPTALDLSIDRFQTSRRPWVLAFEDVAQGLARNGLCENSH